MKLLFAIVQNDDVKPLTKALIDNGINATRISSSGGFLSGGNSTLMIGVEPARLQNALDIVKKYSNRRVAAVPAPVAPVTQLGENPILPINVSIGGATVFVVDAEDFYKF